MSPKRCCGPLRVGDTTVSVGDATVVKTVTFGDVPCSKRGAQGNSGTPKINFSDNTVDTSSNNFKQNYCGTGGIGDTTGSIPSSTPPTPLMPTSTTKPFRYPLKYWDIYVDDFLGLVQGNQWTRRMVKRILFQALDRVFRPIDDDDTEFREEPASIKKLRKGDARWTTTKIVLGWLLDTLRKTLSLPDHRAERLLQILHSIPPTQRSIATKA